MLGAVGMGNSGGSEQDPQVARQEYITDHPEQDKDALNTENCKNIIKKNQEAVQGATSHPCVTEKCQRGRRLTCRGKAKVLIPSVTEPQGNTKQAELAYWRSGE